MFHAAEVTFWEYINNVVFSENKVSSSEKKSRLFCCYPCAIRDHDVLAYQTLVSSVIYQSLRQLSVYINKL